MRRLFVEFLSFAVLVGCSSGGSGGTDSNSQSQFCGGSGTTSDPYLVCTEAQLALINSLNSSSFKLANDVAVSSQWKPIEYFLGTLDGNGKTISGISITFSQSAVDPFYGGGLVNRNGNGATIKNLTVQMNVTGPGVLGGIVGWNYPQGTIQNVTAIGTMVNLYRTSPYTSGSTGGVAGFNAGYIYNATATISASSQGGSVGSITGKNGGMISQCNVATGSLVSLGTQGGYQFAGGVSGITDQYASISNCTSNADIASQSGNAGGISGWNSGTISSSSFSGTLSSGASSIGGIAGYNRTTGSITNCFSTRDININSVSNIGGIAGLNEGSIDRSYSLGNITGQYNVGGLVGKNGYLSAPGNTGSISNCYAKGNAEGASSVGGLVGSNSNSSAGWLINSYSIGSITGTNSGGLVGYSPEAASNSYWDTQASGANSSAAGTGKTTDQLKNLATFTTWDFATIWTISTPSGYPELR